MFRPLHILVLNLTPAMGGAERSLLSLAQEIDRDRFAFTLAVPSDGPLAEGFRRAGHGVFVDGVRLLPRGSIGAAARLFGRLSREVRERQIDLIHSNGIWRLNRAAALSLLVRVPAICHVRDLDPAVLGSLKFRASSRMMRRLVAISQAVRDDLVRRGLPARRIETIYNGIDLAAFAPSVASASMRRTWGAPEGAFLVGIVAQIEPRKGHLDFLRAAREVLAAAPAVRFVIIGGDIHGVHADYGREVAAEAGRSEFAGRVAFAGLVEEIPAAMGAIDLLVVPSSSEPFGRVAVEAMAARRPVVAYRTGGLAEIVEDSRTGLVVPAGDTAALSRAILGLAGDRGLAAEMGQRGRERAEKLFGIEAHVPAMEKLYEEAGRCKG